MIAGWGLEGEDAVGLVADPGPEGVADPLEYWKEEEKIAGRPALAAARARVTSRHARKRTPMGF